MARPKKAPEEKRQGWLGVRLTEVERVELEHTAALRGLTTSEFMRSASLGYRLPPALEQQRQQAVLATALMRVGVNLNQIARHMNAGRGAPADLSHTIARVASLLDQLYDAGHPQQRPVV